MTVADQSIDLLTGCTMCGRRLVDGAGRELPEVKWVWMDRGPLLGRMESIKVPLCRQCHATLTTTEGIARITSIVNRES